MQSHYQGMSPWWSLPGLLKFCPDPIINSNGSDPFEVWVSLDFTKATMTEHG